MIEKGAFSKRRLKISFKKKRIWATAFIVIGYSISFYLFFLFWREMLRYQTLNEYGEMMVLTPVETYFYNFFYAGLAILTGLSFGAYSLFATQFRLPGQVRHTITNNFSGLQWYFVYIITKLGVFYGIFSWSGELYLFVSLYEEFWFLFPLILVVLALHQWIKIRAFFRNSFKLMILSLTGVILFAGILAAIPFFDYKSFNHSVLKQTVGYNYTIHLPHAESSKGNLRMSLIEDLYIGYPKKGKIDSAVVVVNNSLIPLTKNNLSEWLKRSKNNSGDFGSRPLTIALRCDKNVKTGDVTAIIDLLRENDIRLLTFMTDQRRGLGMVLRPTFQELTPNTPGWLPSLREESNKLKLKKTLKIKLVNSRFSVNDTLETAAALAKRIEFFTLKNIGNYCIDIEIDEVSSYQSFVQLYDLLYQSIYLNRMEFARRNLSKEYDPSKNWDSSLQDTLSQVFPLNLWLLNEKERAYLQREH